jgi:glycosyltransferase involved in cell wall biosynthesis
MSSVEPTTIITNSLGYNQRRNFADLAFTRYRVEKRLDLTRFPIKLSYRILGKLPKQLQNTHLRLPFSRPAVHHFFNTVSFSKVPWVATFETAIPRWETKPRWLTRRGLEAIASDWCLGIIAFSKCSKRIQDLFLKEHFPEYRDVVMKKCTVLHPSQLPMLSDYSERRQAKGLRLLLVGNQIFSKGGREIVRVVKRLADQGADIKVRIISAMQPDNYATFTTKDDVVRFRRVLDNAVGPVEFLGTVPNARVLELLQESHVALLPTYADTYGYFVLEAQATGCPVISTNIRALPEINPPDCGWNIEIPLDKRNNAQLKTLAERDEVSIAIESGLEKSLRECLNDPSIAERKGRSAISRVINEHAVSDRINVLEKVYDVGIDML